MHIANTMIDDCEDGGDDGDDDDADEYYYYFVLFISGSGPLQSDRGRGLHLPRAQPQDKLQGRASKRIAAVNPGRRNPRHFTC